MYRASHCWIFFSRVGIARASAGLGYLAPTTASPKRS